MLPPPPLWVASWLADGRSFRGSLLFCWSRGLLAFEEGLLIADFPQAFVFEAKASKASNIWHSSAIHPVGEARCRPSRSHLLLSLGSADKQEATIWRMSWHPAPAAVSLQRLCLGLIFWFIVSQREALCVCGGGVCACCVFACLYIYFYFWMVGRQRFEKKSSDFQQELIE